MSDASPWIKDGTLESFPQDVQERSREVAVIVDFWAAWCQPCRMLGPLLERLVTERQGLVELVKVDVDAQPELAGAAEAQSIPFVLAFRDGQPVDQFVGLLPEDQLREWIARLIPSPAERLVQEARSLEETDRELAEGKYRQALALEPQFDAARIGLARVLLAADQDEECRAIVAELETRGFLEPEVATIKSQLELRQVSTDAGGLDAARAAAEADPSDLDARLKYADALAVAGRHREALDIGLDIVRQDRSGVGVAAKETMVKIFGLLGPTSDIADEYRRKLTTLLY